jgi:hypothetical protein
MKTCKACPTKISERSLSDLCRRDYLAVYNKNRERPTDRTVMGSPEYRTKMAAAKSGRAATPEQLANLKAGREHLRLKQHGAADQFYASTYVPGPRYHYDCGSCDRPYITNLSRKASICPFCFARGVAVKQAQPA